MKKYEIVAPKGKVIDESELKKNKIKFIDERDILPESWEDLGKVTGYFADSYAVSGLHTVTDSATYDESPNIFPTLGECTAAMVLAQLCQLRDRYNREALNSWCDWTSPKQVKYGIYFQNEIMTAGIFSLNRTPLVFKTEILRNKFLSCPKINVLITLAKPLL